MLREIQCERTVMGHRDGFSGQKHNDCSLEMHEEMERNQTVSMPVNRRDL